ncbi:MAG: PrsW family intramembrane metalloprotease [Alphaproteobacteria bacterium]|nr:PrsW family intramembrane metalloprotease [Alphaproteobacteria bacterium]
MASSTAVPPPPSPPSLRRPPGARTTLWATLLVLGIALPGAAAAGVSALSMLVAEPGVALAATGLATATAVPYCAAILWVDRNEQEPWWLLLTAFLWGALAATGVALAVNATAMAIGTAVVGDAERAATLTAWVVAPLTEEPLKATALAFLFTAYRHHVDNVLDGLVYGALVGMGFAWFENILYYAHAAEEGASAMVVLAWMRGVLSGVGSHATFTALVGVGVGLSRVLRRGRGAWLVPWAGLAVAIVAHATWNIFSAAVLADAQGPDVYLVRMPLAVVLLQFPFLITLLGVTLATWRQEEGILRTFLALEPRDVVLPGDIDRLVPARRRLEDGARAFLTSGVLGWWQHRRLAQLLVRIAFERWHHLEDGLPWEVDEDAEVAGLRARVRELRRRGVVLAHPAPGPRARRARGPR